MWKKNQMIKTQYIQSPSTVIIMELLILTVVEQELLCSQD